MDIVPYERGEGGMDGGEIAGQAHNDGDGRDFVPIVPYENLIIEGDNFDALRYLKMCYSGKVKCIYIDPPYNTGNKDFVYNDRFIDANDLWRHSFS